MTRWLIALCLLAGTAHAEDYTQRMNTPFPIPDHYRLVNDYESVLRISHRVALEQRLQALEARNGTQIVFLSVPNTGKDGTWAYAEAVFKKWDIGNNGQGNGILFLIGNEGTVILTGPGIAGAVPDVLLARITRNSLLPAAQREDLTEGIEQALDAMIKASESEQTWSARNRPRQELVPDTLSRTQQSAIALLGAALAAYAGWLLWRRSSARVT